MPKINLVLLIAFCTFCVTIAPSSAAGQQVPGEAFGTEFQAPEEFVNFGGHKISQKLDLQSDVIKSQTNLIFNLKTRIDSLEERVRALETKLDGNNEQ